MVKKLLNSGILAVVALALVAESAPAQKTAKPEPVCARAAFFEMYKPARLWAKDMLVLSVGSNEVPGIRSEGGKFPMWTAIFVSPSRRSARTFTYSVIEHGATPKGVFMGVEQAWTGATAQVQPFRIDDFQVDSDAAYQAALHKAGAWVKQHPDKPVALSLGSTSRFPSPVWFLLWGNKTSGYAVYVNAMTGTVMKGN